MDDRDALREEARVAMEECKAVKQQITIAKAMGAPAWEIRPLTRVYEEKSVRFHRAYAAYKYPEEM